VRLRGTVYYLVAPDWNVRRSDARPGPARARRLPAVRTGLAGLFEQVMGDALQGAMGCQRPPARPPRNRHYDQARK
jgi:hypothetical protein